MTLNVTGRTSLLAIIADPVHQASTPGLINAALSARGHDAILVPLHVAGGDLARALSGLRVIQSFKGAVVSMPHKTALLDLIDDASPEARRIGACNVFRRTREGRLIGAMFDGTGFVAGLRGAGHEVENRRVFLAGAGGAASAIAHALAEGGASSLTIHNRTSSKARALGEQLRAEWPQLEISTGSSPKGNDLVVNATSLGMLPGDALPLDVTLLDPGSLVAEVVIHPAITRLLQQAGERGCLLHPGKPMLEAQIELMIGFILG